MNTRVFVLIIALKLLALQVIALGLFFEMRAGAGAGSIFITVGSLLFAIASNTTLFIVVKSNRRSRRELNNDELDNP